MRHLLTTIIALFVCLSSAYCHVKVTPNTPNLEEIKESTYQIDSPYYYPNLYQRYAENDTTLTLDEYRHLYLGYQFQEDYNPYYKSPYSDMLATLLKEDNNIYSTCDSIVKYALLANDDQPFNLVYINHLIYSYKCNGENENATIWSTKLHLLIDAILSTGNGLTQESAWYVIYPQQEYEVVNLIGLNVAGQEFIQSGYDYLTVETNVLDIEGYYFNVKNLLEEYNRKFDTQY